MQDDPFIKKTQEETTSSALPNIRRHWVPSLPGY